MEQEELDKELVGIGSQPVPDLDLPTPGTSIPGPRSSSSMESARNRSPDPSQGPPWQRARL